MNKYRVIINDPKHPGGNRIIFNQVYEIPEGETVINYLIFGKYQFLNDLLKSDISINDPNLKWDIYFESPLEFEQDELIKKIQQELIDNNFNTDYLTKTIYELLDDIGLHYSEKRPLDKDLKEFILEEISHHL